MYETGELPPNPADDWITLAELGRLIGVSAKTARLRAIAGQLDQYKHGVSACGRRQFSRTLVKRELERRWSRAIARQDQEVRN